MSDSLDLHADPMVRRVLFVAAILLVTVPFLQAGSQLWPLQLSNIQWRFGAANALSSVLLLPFLGLTLLLLLSRTLHGAWLAKTIGVIATCFTLGLLASTALFVLDAQELKTIVNSAMMNTFTMTTIRVGLISGVFLIAFALLALAGFTSSGSRPAGTVKKGEKRAEEGAGLIVGR
ncbi:MAG: hypothetical protein P3C10_11365 [Gemmatimonadota bacterium]|nr:hypothetical protein [Gemmatimonadota bacterium]